MKRVNNIYNNIYNNICNIENIMMEYNKIKSHVKNKNRIENFENYYTSNIILIKKILDSKKYIPSKYYIFIISEPKYRVIMSQNMIDKVINHLCAHYLLIPSLEKSLIDTNIATRLNRGTSYGIKLLKKYLNILKNKNFYYLKFDISKYFYNIDHNILKNMVSKKIRDKDTLKIIFNIIDSTNSLYINNEINRLKNIILNKNLDNKIKQDILNIPLYKYNKGLPIGNMTSQFLAIFYLNDFDHFIKEKLKIKYYIRYMDDGVIFFEDKEYLKYCLKEIKLYLIKYKLVLNNKIVIKNIKDGINFLGYRFTIYNKKVIIQILNKNKRKIIKKFKHNFNKINNYNGYLKYANKKIFVH